MWDLEQTKTLALNCCLSFIFLVVVAASGHRVSHLSHRVLQCPSEAHNTADQQGKTLAPS